MARDTQTRDMMELLDRLEAQVADGKRVLLSNRIMVEEGEFMAILDQLLVIEINQSFFLLLLCCCLVVSWRCLCNSHSQCAAMCHIHYSEGGNLQPAFGPPGTGVEEAERIFIGAATIGHRHRNFQQPNVHRQLAAMVIPVVQHDRA